MPPAVAIAIPGRDRKSRRRSCRGRCEEFGRLYSTYEASNKADHKSAAESVEGRRPVGGKASSNACSGLSAGFSMSPKRRAYGSRREGLKSLTLSRVRPSTRARCGKAARRDLWGRR